MIRSLSLYIFSMLFIGCQTHQKIEDEGGVLSYKQPPKTNKLIPAGGLDLTERVDLLERDTVRKQEIDATVYSLKQQADDLQSRIESLENTLDALSKEKSQTSPKTEKKPSEVRVAKNSFEQGEIHFSEKKWKQAIFSYEEFRKNQPQSAQVPVATLRIGVSFMQLGLNKEARVFFEELVNRFPKTKDAKEAQKFLDSLK